MHPAPPRYAGTVILARIDDRAQRPRAAASPHLVRPLGGDEAESHREAWAAVALSFQGLKELGVPEDTLASFPPEFQQGMAARAADLGDDGERARALGAAARAPGRPPGDLCAGPDPARLEAVIAGARDALREVPGVAPIWEQDTYMLPNERTSFGFKDGISNPAIEGSGIPGTNPQEAPFKAGEFVLGYCERERRAARAPARAARPQRQLRRLPQAPHPRGGLPPVRPRPRQESKTRSCWPPSSSAAGRVVRRWCSPPERDDPELGADPERNNAFRYAADTTARAQVPARCPRADVPARLAHHRRGADARIIRRSSSYGPMLPEGVLEDDGADRGILFFCLQASLARGFEFVKTQWVNDGTFFGTPRDGPAGRAERRDSGVHRPPAADPPGLTELPQFVVNRGGVCSSCPACGRSAGSRGLDT